MTDAEHIAIQLAAATYAHPAVRETHALEQLGMTPTRFWQHVHALIDRPDVLATYPTEVRRLQRLRDARRQQRCPRQGSNLRRTV